MKRGMAARLMVALAVAAVSACGNSARITAAEEAVRSRMKDPGSVQFKTIKVAKTGAVCGDFNAKNSYGAYVGFNMFAYTKEGELLIAPAFKDVSTSPPSIAGLSSQMQQEVLSRRKADLDEAKSRLALLKRMVDVCGEPDA